MISAADIKLMLNDYKLIYNACKIHKTKLPDECKVLILYKQDTDPYLQLSKAIIHDINSPEFCKYMTAYFISCFRSYGGPDIFEYYHLMDSERIQIDKQLPTIMRMILDESIKDPKIMTEAFFWPGSMDGKHISFTNDIYNKVNENFKLHIQISKTSN